MARKRMPEEQDEQIVELTDVVEEGDIEQAKSTSSQDDSTDADLQRAFDSFFDKEDSEQQASNAFSAHSAVDEDEDNLDLDALFDELDEESTEYGSRARGAVEQDPSLSPSGDEDIEDNITSLPVDEEAEFNALLEGLDENETGEFASSFEAPLRQAGVQKQTASPTGQPLSGASHGSSTAPDGDIVSKLQEQIDTLQSKQVALEEQLAAQSEEHDLPSRMAQTMEHLSADHPLWGRLQQAVSEEIQRTVEHRFQELSSRLDSIEQRLHWLDDFDPNRFQAVVQEVQSLQSAQENMRNQSEWADVSSQLLEELRAEIDKAVPAAAAKIIREEIQALSDELDEEEEE